MPIKANSNSNAITLNLTRERECKGSVRFKAVPSSPTDEPIVETIYINRPFSNDLSVVTLTVAGQ